LREAVERRGETGVFRDVRGVDAVVIRQRQGPRTARLDRDSLDIKARQGAGGEQRIANEIAVVDLLYGDDRLARWVPMKTLPVRSAIGA
jgi:hypothetical protein